MRDPSATTSDPNLHVRPLTSVPPTPSSGFGLGRILGVQIRVDWSLMIVFALVVINLASGVFPAWHPNWSASMAWAVATIAAVLFFASVLLHELAHALVARRYGIPVRQITLFLFGGVAHLEGDPPSPKAEFLMAIVGPLVSVILGFLATAIAMQLAGGSFAAVPSTSDDTTVRQVMLGVGPVATLLLWLGPINLFLGVLNLMPGYPLDGGRVLRSALWWMSGDLVKATRWAAGAGRVCAWVLIAFGVMQIVAGMFGQGIWLLLIGWFLNSAARLGARPQNAHELLLHDVPVSRVMSAPDRVEPGLTVHRFIHEHLTGGDETSVAVESEGSLLGIVKFNDVLRIPQSEWSNTHVADIMTPVSELSTLPPDADAERALDVLARADVDQVPIVEGRHLYGLVRRRDLVRWLALQGQPAHAA